jgi:hypothetical protein
MQVGWKVNLEISHKNPAVNFNPMSRNGLVLQVKKLTFGK